MPTSPMTTATEKTVLALAYCAVLTVLLFPIWYVDIVPTPDFPSHLSRLYVLSVLDTNATLADMYEAKWEFLPNMGLDLFALAAMKAVPLITAGKLFMSASILLWMAGTAWLSRVLTGRWQVAPLFAALFVLNTAFFLGFMNFMVAAGVAIVGLAAWASMSGWNPWTRSILILPLTMVAYFSHIFGFAVLACCILGFELGREIAEPRISWQRGLRRLAVAFAVLLPVIAIFIFITPHHGHGGEWDFRGLTRSYARIGHASYLTYGRPYYVAVVFILLVGAAGLATRKIAIDRRMWPVLIGLGIAALLAPIKMMGGEFVDIRLPAIIGALGLASLSIRAGRPLQLIACAILAGLLIYRAVIMTDTWTRYDREYAELAEAVELIEPKSKVLAAKIKPASRPPVDVMMIYSHFLDLIGVQRNFFTPIVMAWPSQHPLRTIEPYRKIAAVSSRQGILPADSHLPILASGEPSWIGNRLPYLIRWQCNFDYVVSFDVGNGRNPAPAFLRELKSGEFFTLYRVVPDGGTCG